jgi:hypothetical protein
MLCGNICSMISIITLRNDSHSSQTSIFGQSKVEFLNLPLRSLRLCVEKLLARKGAKHAKKCNLHC